MNLFIKNLGKESTEAFGPYCIYHFSRGLTLNIGAKEAYLRGGGKLCKVYEAPEGLEPGLPADADAYIALVEQIETEVGVRVIAYAQKNLLERGSQFEEFPPAGEPTHVLAPDGAIFRVDSRYISDSRLGEELLGKFQTLDFYSSVLISNRADGDFSLGAREICAYLKERIWSGHLGPADLDRLIKEVKHAGIPAEQAFFLFNGSSLAEDMRSAMLRACYHFSSMTKNLWLVNQSNTADDPLYDSLFETDGSQRELVHSSEVADRVADEFASSVIACYSTLDLLYELFVYLTREPFGKPDFPKGLHFPDEHPERALRDGAVDLLDDLSPADAPLAIPNLPANKFTSLRRLRNDLVHNMAADEIRTRVHIGIGLSPVNYQELQYTLYLTRDIDEVDGRPVRHPWSRRFYQQQRDAQHVLYDWLIDTWRCAFDTVEWLIHRLNHRASNAGLVDETVK